MPNLEYWHYLDRPDIFAAYVVLPCRALIASCDSHRSINDSDDAFERMIAAVRFTFTKDLKFIVSN